MRPGDAPPTGHPDWDKPSGFRDRLADAETAVAGRCLASPAVEEGRFFDYIAQLARLDGDVAHVFLSPEENNRGAYADMLFTHNHIGNDSFSVEDILAAFNGNWREVRAVSPVAAYSAKRPDRGWPMESWLVIARAAAASIRRASTEARSRANTAGREFGDPEWIEAVTATWRRVVSGYGIAYSEFEAPGIAP